jgi:hypothetical protein
LYIDVTAFIAANADKEVKGISFWLYNTSSIPAGALGMWVKASNARGVDWQIRYNFLQDGTGLDYTGWRRFEIPFDSTAWYEEDYSSGYSSAAPRPIDWKDLQYLKIGFWGTFYNNEAGYSVSAKVDDLRFVATSPLTLPETGGPDEPGDSTKPVTPGEKGCAKGCGTIAFGSGTGGNGPVLFIGAAVVLLLATAVLLRRKSGVSRIE